MGQARRRKAEIEKLKTVSATYASAAKGISLDAIHEAGHAGARFLTAQNWGYEPHEAVAYIEMRRPDAAPTIIETATTQHRAVATTYGPRFPADMNAIAKNFDTDAELISGAREAGIDVEKWASIQAAISIGGPVAEMRATGRTTIPPGCQGDIAEAFQIGKAIGWSDEDTEAVLEVYRQRLDQQFSELAIWNGLLALAKALPQEGRMEGREAWEIYSRAVESYRQSERAASRPPPSKSS